VGDDSWARAEILQREIGAELGRSANPTALPGARGASAFDDSGEPTAPNFRPRSGVFVKLLGCYMEALRAQRATGVPD